MHFLCPGCVHLFTDNLLQFLQRAVGQGKVGVNARRHLVDEACSQHEPVAGGLSLRRGFPQCFA